MTTRSSPLFGFCSKKGSWRSQRWFSLLCSISGGSGDSARNASESGKEEPARPPERFLKTVEFNPDEFWHLHSAWCLSRGMIPYRDFFEHHTPWLYFLLAPIFSLYRVDVDPNAAVAFIFLARRIMIFFAAIRWH